MKNFKICLALIASMFLAFTACSKDEDNNNDNSIVGKWKPTEVYIDGQWKKLLVKDYYVQFKSDMTFDSYSTIDANIEDYSDDGYVTLYGSYEYNKDEATITMTARGGNTTEEEYFIDGKIQGEDLDDFSKKIFVKERKGNTMIVKLISENGWDYYPDGWEFAKLEKVN
jgi:hypothetical protein